MLCLADQVYNNKIVHNTQHVHYEEELVTCVPLEKKEEEEEEMEVEVSEKKENTKVHVMVVALQFIMKQSYICALISMMVSCNNTNCNAM